MRTAPFVRWIANSAARLAGRRGAVTQQADEPGWSRQSIYDHARKFKAAVEGEHSGGPSQAALIKENKALRQLTAELWDRLFQNIEFPPAKQQQFAVRALAMGLSHS
jgi:hypothetical protein